MDFQTQKLDFIDWLVNLKDEKILNKLFAIRNKNDWFQELSHEEKQSIKRGQQDYKSGKIECHENVMAEMKSKYNIK